jgi:tetratricopeptide (TPR) repeat protein
VPAGQGDRPRFPGDDHQPGDRLPLRASGEEALAELQQAIELDPGYWFAWLQLGRVHELAGRHPEALEALRTARRLEDSYPEVLANLARVQALAGQKARARALLEEVHRRSRRVYVPTYHMAAALAALGERDRAFVELGKALEQRSSFMCWLRTDPAMDPLRTDRRFSDLVRRVGLWELTNDRPPRSHAVGG